MLSNIFGVYQYPTFPILFLPNFGFLYILFSLLNFIYGHFHLSICFQMTCYDLDLEWTLKFSWIHRWGFWQRLNHKALFSSVDSPRGQFVANCALQRWTWPEKVSGMGYTLGGYFSISGSSLFSLLHGSCDVSNFPPLYISILFLLWKLPTMD